MYDICMRKGIDGSSTGTDGGHEYVSEKIAHVTKQKCWSEMSLDMVDLISFT